MLAKAVTLFLFIKKLSHSSSGLNSCISTPNTQVSSRLLKSSLVQFKKSPEIFFWFSWDTPYFVYLLFSFGNARFQYFQLVGIFFFSKSSNNWMVLLLISLLYLCWKVYVRDSNYFLYIFASSQKFWYYPCIIIIIIIYSFRVSHISVSWWFFTGVWETASLLKCLELVSGFWPFSAMLSFG